MLNEVLSSASSNDEASEDGAVSPLSLLVSSNRVL